MTPLIKTFGKLSKEVPADTAAKDPLTRKVYDSYMAFPRRCDGLGELSETGYRDTGGWRWRSRRLQ